MRSRYGVSAGIMRAIPRSTTSGYAGSNPGEGTGSTGETSYVQMPRTAVLSPYPSGRAWAPGGSSPTRRRWAGDPASSSRSSGVHGRVWGSAQIESGAPRGTAPPGSLKASLACSSEKTGIAPASRPGGTNTWLKKYIFPGGYTPALSEVLTAIEKVGLWVTDMEILRLHYAETLRHWRQRFLANRERIKQTAGYDDRFCRMWEFYLAS